MYTQLLVKHFENSVPKVVRLPVPQRLQRVLAAILILHNPEYPRHFLNGCYLILQQDTDVPLSDSNDPDDGLECRFSSLEESLLSLIRCPEERWHHLQTWSESPLFSRHLPLVITSRVLGWPRQPDITGSPALLSEGPSLVLSMKLSYAQKAYAALQCYITQFSANSWITDGSEYFSTKYPAKSSLVEHETTLAWVYGATGKPVGYIQYISLENNKGESQILITGLAVEDSHRRRGFGRGLIFAVIRRMWRCKEIWVAVQEENHVASSLYFQCGFVIRKRNWNFSMTQEVGAH